MKYSWLLLLALLVPALAGFECTVETDGDGDGDVDADSDADGDGDGDADGDGDGDADWQAGDPCDYETEARDSFCVDAGNLLFCNENNVVQEWACADAECDTPGSGVCQAYDDGFGEYDWCVCPGGWTPGATCDYWTDYPTANLCVGETTALMCTTSNVVEAWDCASACDGGYCAYDDTMGADWCVCPAWEWAPGYTCDYYNQYDEATCDGNLLTYCAETNIIGEIDCQDQCDATVGAGSTASCGVQVETGYNGCICEIATCGYAPYCADSFWYVQCVDGADYWTNCDDYCVAEGLGTKGVCEVNACICAS